MSDEEEPIIYTPEAWKKACEEYRDAPADFSKAEAAYTTVMRLYRVGKRIDPALRLPWMEAKP